MCKIMNIGHRGARGYNPENTLVSFQDAINMKSDGIELDVHLTSDGAIIVIHDHTIDRVTNATGLVKDLSLPQLKAFLIDGKHEIPLLSEVFDLVNRQCLINIELKVKDTAKPVVRLIEKYVSEGWNYSDFLISSFDWTALQEVRDMHSEIPLGVLTETDLDLAVAFAEFIRAETIHPHFHLLTAENTARMQQKRLRVFAWTVNEPEDIQKIKSFNVNGIITDFPNRI